MPPGSKQPPLGDVETAKVKPRDRSLALGRGKGAVKGSKHPEVSPAAKLDAKGIEWVCDQIIEGRGFKGIADTLGIGFAGLYRWVASDPGREQMIAAARIASARAADEKAELVIGAAKSKLGLMRARELATHLRWRAKVSDPKRYGDRLEVEQKTTVTDLSDAQLDARLADLRAREALFNARPDTADAG